MDVINQLLNSDTIDEEVNDFINNIPKEKTFLKSLIDYFSAKESEKIINGEINIMEVK